MQAEILGTLEPGQIIMHQVVEEVIDSIVDSQVVDAAEMKTIKADKRKHNSKLLKYNVKETKSEPVKRRGRSRSMTPAPERPPNAAGTFLELVFLN